MRKAAISVHLNIAEAASRKSVVKNYRYYEISRSAIIEIDAAFDIAEGLEYFTVYSKENLGNTMTKCFKLLTGLINR